MPELTSTASAIDRDRLVARYRRNRAQTRVLLDFLSDEDVYYSQAIALRHPFVFYEGHIPAFSFNTLVRGALGGVSIDPALEDLFARGIDPPTDRATAIDAARHREIWPSRDTVQRFAREADERVIEALKQADIDGTDAPFVILEHEAMHQETLLYLLHQLPYEKKNPPVSYRPSVGADAVPSRWTEIAPGPAALGIDRSSVVYAWDNECPHHVEHVPAFEIESGNVTNAAYMEFVDAGGYREPRLWRPEDWKWVRSEGMTHPSFWQRWDGRWYWRGLFEPIPLPPAWPVYVSHAEAEAYARWRGVRLPTEAEFQRAALGHPAWRETPDPHRHGVFDFASWDPQPAGSHPDGRSAWGVDDLVGNGWEWTSTVFAPFPGFRPQATYPQYSADFFDGDHVVMKGASPATACDLLRPTFRNWFRRRYPYVYATFRCAR